MGITFVLVWLLLFSCHATLHMKHVYPVVSDSQIESFKSLQQRTFAWNEEHALNPDESTITVSVEPHVMKGKGGINNIVAIKGKSSKTIYSQDVHVFHILYQPLIQENQDDTFEIPFDVNTLEMEQLQRTRTVKGVVVDSGVHISPTPMVVSILVWMFTQ